MKKILTTICSIIISIFVFAGCSLFEVNRTAYYNSVVVRVGDETFYKEDLIDAFQNYGYQYVQNYGYTLEEGVNTSIETMINRKLLINHIKDDSSFALTDNEKAGIRKEAFDYINESLETFEDQVLIDWELNEEDEDNIEDGEDTPLRAAKTVYEPTVIYEDGNVVLTAREPEETFSNIAEHFDFDTYKETSNVTREAYTRYVKQLQITAKAKGKTTDESTVLREEENRLIKTLTDSKYLTKFQNVFEDDYVIKTEKVVNEYIKQYEYQKALFDSDEAAYHSLMAGDSTLVYYHPNSGNEYINVDHILFKFSDLQLAKIKELQVNYATRYYPDLVATIEAADNTKPEYTEAINTLETLDDYMNDLENIAQETKFKYEDEDGNIQYDPRNIFDIYSEIVNYVSMGTTVRDRAIHFEEKKYIYNEDTGNVNKDFDYVINLDTSVTDKMVKSFADTSRSLDTSNGGQGAGSISSLVITSYGYHIIFHAGKVTNLVDAENIDTLTYNQLCTKLTRSAGDKSIFQYIYDSLKLDDQMNTDYNTYVNKVIEDERNKLTSAGIKIEYYIDNYKDLF